MTSTDLRNQAFCRKPPNWAIHDAFPVIRLELWIIIIFLERSQSLSAILATFYQGHILLTWHSSWTGLSWYLSGLITGHDSSSFFSTLEESYYAQPPPRERVVMLHVLRRRIHTLFTVLLHGELAISPLFVYLLIQLFIYISMKSWILTLRFGF